MHTILTSWTIAVAEDGASEAAQAVSELQAVEAVEVDYAEEESWATLKLDSRLQIEGSEEGPDPEKLIEAKQAFGEEVEQLLSASRMGELTQQGEDRADNQASGGGAAGGSESGREALKWVREQNDKLGLGIDKGIEHPVAAMRLLGIRTTQSCEGHDEHGLPYPWIDVEPEDLPKLQEALTDHPLPGFGFENGRRLLPQEALGHNPFSLMSQQLPGVEVEMQPEARKQLLAELSDKRAELQRWADRILSASGKPGSG